MVKCNEVHLKATINKLDMCETTQEGLEILIKNGKYVYISSENNKRISKNKYIRDLVIKESYSTPTSETISRVIQVRCKITSVKLTH